MSNKFEVNPTKVATDVIGESSRLVAPQGSGTPPPPPPPPTGVEDRVGVISYNSTSPSNPESNFTSIGLNLNNARYSLLGDETYTGTDDYRHVSSYELAQMGLYCYNMDAINIQSDTNQYLATLKLYNIRTSGDIRDVNLVSFESWHEGYIPLGVPMSSYAISNPLVGLLNGQRTDNISNGTPYANWEVPTTDTYENNWLRNPTLAFSNGGSLADVRLAPKKHPMATEVSIFNQDFLSDSSNVHILCFSYKGSPRLYVKLEFPEGSEHLYGSGFYYLNLLADAMNDAIRNYRYEAGLPYVHDYITTDDNGVGEFILRAMWYNQGNGGDQSSWIYDLALIFKGRGMPSDVLSDKPLLDGAQLINVDSTLTFYPDISNHPFELPMGWTEVSIAVDTSYQQDHGTPQPFNIHSRQRYWTQPQLEV